MLTTIVMRHKVKLEGWASLYVYPKNRIKISQGASIHVVNGLLTFAKPWYEVAEAKPCFFEMESDSRLECNGNFDLVRGSKCVIKESAVLRVGNGVRIGKGSKLQCNHEISIGNHCWISDNVIISDTGKIVIEDGVWIGNGAKIEGGLRIGKNVVIGEGVCVTEDVDEGRVITK